MVERSGSRLSPGVPPPEWPSSRALIVICPEGECPWTAHADQASAEHVHRLVDRYNRHYRVEHLQGTLL